MLWKLSNQRSNKNEKASLRGQTVVCGERREAFCMRSFCLAAEAFLYGLLVSTQEVGSIGNQLKGWEKLEEVCGYRFRDSSLMRQALCHSSFVNEHKRIYHHDNERLEFLGDAVLELATSRFLFDRYPGMPEGDMTKLRASLVCEPTLAMCAREFDLPRYLLLGRGEEMTGGRKRDSIVSDALEALIGAIYLDGGFESADAFIRRFVLNDIEHKRLFYDSKTILQEVVQRDFRDCETVYELIREEGPDHAKRFVVDVQLNGRCLGNGSGSTKKAAEQEAAYHALIALEQEGLKPGGIELPELTEDLPEKDARG